MIETNRTRFGLGSKRIVFLLYVTRDEVLINFLR